MNNYPTCPGITKFVRPTPEYLTCQKCLARVEIWSDESETKCGKCGAHVSREVASCLDYCEFADKCKEIIEKKVGN